MSDLIDRQAAIDAVDRAVTKEAARWSIQALPSAQPQTVIDQLRWERDVAVRQLHDLGYEFGEAVMDAQPQRKPGKTLAEEVERIKRELTDIFTEQMSAQPQRYNLEENLLAYAHDMGVSLEQAKKELTRVTHIAPQIDPQHRRGRWIRKESELSWWYECSECGESPLFDPYEHEVRTPFCPFCGSDMRGEEDADD